MEKVIFIYGFTGSRKHSDSAQKIFDNLLCFKYDSKLKQPLEEIAKKLEKFILSNTNKREKINLIGVSAGGIIADYYTKFVNPTKVKKVATICAPFKGTYVPYFYSRKRRGLKELSYSSNFLKRLNAKRLGKNKIINFYSFLDFIVPGNSGKGENPRFIYALFHPMIQYNKKILKKIKKFFEK